MTSLADDLIGDILTRLPVKSLLRFRCVCKTWCALIDNSSFIKQHINHSTQTKSKHKLISSNLLNIYSVGIYSLTDEPLKLVQPINPNHPITMFLGSCNGLLCLWYGFEKNLVLLWNPATRNHVKLPVAKPRSSVYSHYTSEYGFGYDSVSDDYKVVKVQQFTKGHTNSFVSETNVYSLRSNSWRMVEDTTHPLICGHEPAALACGALHWIGSRLVYAFDLATEKYRVLTLPKYHVDDQFMRHLLSELGGCLSIVCDHSMASVFDVWVMKDYSVAESWTKLLTLSYTEINKPIKHLIPLAYSEIGNEVLLMLNWETLFWYNLELGTIKIVDVRMFSCYFEPVIFLESLVCLGKKAEHDERLGKEKVEPKEEDSS